MADEDLDKEIEEIEDRVLGIHPDADMVTPWDRDIAAARARELGIELTDAHWEVVKFLRDRFREQGQVEHARDLHPVMAEKWKAQGGLKYLYTLFPGGPVHQGSYIAGVPEPHDATDPSFGTVA